MAKKSMEVVKGLDLQRYMGRWYEIASFPSRFQPRNGENTRATYTLKDDGTVDVLNETWTNGSRGFIQGTAYKANPNSDEAKLKVKFYVPPFLPIFPVTGDYWVLYIDDDYQYALVGQPSRNYLWILSRKPHMEEVVYNMLVEKAKEEEYDVSKLHKTPQSENPPEDAPVDTKGTWWFNSLLGIFECICNNLIPFCSFGLIILWVCFYINAASSFLHLLCSACNEICKFST